MVNSSEIFSAKKWREMEMAAARRGSSEAALQWRTAEVMRKSWLIWPCSYEISIIEISKKNRSAIES